MPASHFNQLGTGHENEQEAAGIADLISGIREAALRPYSQAADQYKGSSPGVSEIAEVNGLHLPTLPGAPTVTFYSVKAQVKEIFGSPANYEHAHLYWNTERDSMSIHFGRDLETGEATSEICLSNGTEEPVTVRNSVLIAAAIEYARTTLDLLAQLETPQP